MNSQPLDIVTVAIAVLSWTVGAEVAAIIGAVAVALFDDDTGGNVRHWGYIVDSAGDPITRSWSAGDVVMVEAGALQFVIGG